MSLALKRAGAAASRVAGRRNMSGHGSPEEIFQSKEMWLKTTAAMTAFLIIPYAAFTIYKESQHEHGNYVQMPHMKVRHKAFPWTANDCDFFDLKCHRLAKAGVAHPFDAAKHHEGHGHGAHH